MRAGTTLVLALIATTPLTVRTGAAHRDSATTTLTFGAGSGDYAEIARGCNGEVLSRASHRFRDRGAALEHRFADALTLGVRTVDADGFGESYASARSGWLWNPYAAFEWRRFGIGGGPVLNRPSWGGPHAPDFTGHLRFGDPQRGLAFALRLFEDVPPYSAGGFASAAFGFRPGGRAEMWLGVTAGEPFDGAGLFLRSRVPLAGGLFAEAGARLGSSEGVGESAFAAGLTWMFTHR